MRKSIQHTITTGRFTLPVVIFICLLSWIVIALVYGEEITTAQQTYTTYALSEQLGLPSLKGKMQYIIGVTLILLIAYALAVINNKFALVRIRATVQTCVFLLFIVSCPMLYAVEEAAITSFSLLLSIYFLFKSYQAQSPVPLFYSFFLLGVGCIILPQLIYLSPMWLIGTAGFQALNFRNLAGALAGITLPFWFLFGHAFYHDTPTLFTGCLREMVHFYPLSSLLSTPAWMIAMYVYLSIIALISTVHIIAYSYEDKIQTRAYLRFLIQFSFYLIVCFLLQPVHGTTLLVTLTETVSILAAHFFVLTNTRTSNVLFIASVAGVITLLAANLWIL